MYITDFENLQIGSKILVESGSMLEVITVTKKLKNDLVLTAENGILEVMMADSEQIVVLTGQDGFTPPITFKEEILEL